MQVLLGLDQDDLALMGDAAPVISCLHDDFSCPADGVSVEL